MPPLGSNPLQKQLKSREAAMDTTAILLDAPGKIRAATVARKTPAPADAVVAMRRSAISTGTEKLLFTGRMPDFPGMGYPLVPGYESVGEVVEAGPESGLRTGQAVFVPGADCYRDVRGLFGGAAATVVTQGARLQPIDAGLGDAGVLLALAATARHVLAGLRTDLPDLIIGHGVVGRLLARLTLAAGGPPPTVWEVDPLRRAGTFPYPVCDPAEDEGRRFATIFEASGDLSGLTALIARLEKGGEIVLAGFYAEPVHFSFPTAFLREARLRVAAEWTPEDMVATRALVEGGHLDLSDLITHHSPAANADVAYRAAFDEPACLKMCLTWEGVQCPRWMTACRS